MRKSWLGLWVWGCPVLVACGGSTGASPGTGGHSANDNPGEGAVAGTQATPAVPQPQPGGTSGSSGIPPEGVCSKVCVNKASFVIDSSLTADQLYNGALRACHNGDQECHTGSVPARESGGNGLIFAGVNGWDGPSVWSPDGWKTIEFSWGDTRPMSLHDGDTFSLTFVKGKQQVLLLEQRVTFTVVQDCAGPCQYAHYDLQGVTFTQGGESNLGGAGASFEGAEAGTSGEGGAASR